MPLSSGTIYKFNKETFENLSSFDEQVKVGLLGSPLNHTDETGFEYRRQKKLASYCIQ